MSRRNVILIIMANLVLLAVVAWLVLRPEDQGPSEPSRPADNNGTPVIPRRPVVPPRVRIDASQVQVGAVTVAKLPGFEARTRIYRDTGQVLYFPTDTKSRRSASVLVTPRVESLGRRVRNLTALSPFLKNPPRVVRLRARGIAGESAAFAVSDARVRTSRAVVLINRGRWSVSVDVMGPQAALAQTTASALRLARSITVR